MTHQYNKLSTLTLGAVFVLATFALAPAPPEKNDAMHAVSIPPPLDMPMMAGQANRTVFATIERVHTTDKITTLQSAEGMTIEIAVPEEALSDLQRGDRVKVSIEDKRISISIERVQDAQTPAPGVSAQAAPRQKARQGAFAFSLD
jgi:hypothetical protein